MKINYEFIGYAVITLMNLYWLWQSKKLQNKDDVIKALKNELELKENAVQVMLESKNQLKHQYSNLLAEIKVLKGQNTVYRRIHGHDQKLVDSQ